MDGRTEYECVKEQLREYRDSATEIRTLQDLIESYRDRLEGLGAKVITDMPRAPSPDNDRLTYMMAEMMELEKELDALLDWRKKERDRIMCQVQKLQRPEEKAVIRYAYMDGEAKQWRDVAFFLFKDQPDFYAREESYVRRVYDIHERAIRQIAERLLH